MGRMNVHLLRPLQSPNLGCQPTWTGHSLLGAMSVGNCWLWPYSFFLGAVCKAEGFTCPVGTELPLGSWSAV